MKDANSALLSNYEVFQLLTDLKEQRKESGKNKHSSGQQNLNTITYETLKYISKTPCRHQSPEIVREFLTAMKSHKLTNVSFHKGLAYAIVGRSRAGWSSTGVSGSLFPDRNEEDPEGADGRVGPWGDRVRTPQWPLPSFRALTLCKNIARSPHSLGSPRKGNSGVCS
ncbi:DNA-directed RNA polymerase III subunit RPC9 isoform X1 [Mustela lutreola]|uniref:DNA-directed RNA polymerase III subunit RPC9 isoform X1 n=1 Tax=Mustela lutreola TaxID=9666 RepID=UPI0027974806|nr:DNA-directed RNA polymerase III subunit RPC9 isoform X1 [Mustela lutreola]